MLHPIISFVFQPVKERASLSNSRQVCLNGIAEAQPLFCKERFYHFKRQHELSAYLLYALTDWKKETACLLRAFAKGRRNNGDGS